jgi:hypothetical protein
MADPNPLPADATSPATIRWESNARVAEVCFSRNAGAEKPFSHRTSGSFDVKRILAGTDYVFRLYSLEEPRQLLHELRVFREIAGKIRVTVDSNPSSFEGKALLEWEITAPVIAEIRVAEAGFAERVVCLGKSGALEIDWLRPGKEYSFRLYNRTGGPSQLLDEVTVRIRDIPWSTLLELFKSTSDTVDSSAELAQFIRGVMPRCLRDKNFLRWFRLWEKSGFHVTPVHFYEPIPDTQSLNEKHWERTPELVGIEMNDATQLHLLSDVFPVFRKEYEQFPIESSGALNLFYLNNGRFEGIDPMIAYGVVRHFKPHLIIEVGGGYSTLLLAQAARENGNTKLLSIEPYPEDFLNQAPAGATTVLSKKVEDIELSFFSRLEADDCLFIDSSHVVRTGGDVNFLFLEVLPRLKPGVIVHVHDIFLPLDYPQDWVTELRRFWTEQYLLQAFLTFNSEFEVLVSSGYLKTYHLEELKAVFPACEPWQGGSFWMRRKPVKGDRPVRDEGP